MPLQFPRDIVSLAKPPRNVPQGLDEGRGGDDGGGQGGPCHSHQGQQHSLVRIRENRNDAATCKVLGQQEFLLCKHFKTEKDSQTVQNKFTGILGDFNFNAFTRRCEYSNLFRIQVVTIHH